MDANYLGSCRMCRCRATVYPVCSMAVEPRRVVSVWPGGANRMMHNRERAGAALLCIGLVLLVALGTCIAIYGP